MDKSVKLKKIILFDTFSKESRNLLDSFQNAGIEVVAATIEEDGFNPENVISAYGFFLGDYSDQAHIPGKTLYFNQVKIPDLWRIEGNNSSARIMNKNKEVGRIFYTEPSHKRLVKVVDWLDEYSNVRLSEHYNKYGAIFCRTIYNRNGQKVARKFYSASGNELIVENFVTESIMVLWQGRNWVFKNKTEFLVFFIKAAGWDKCDIFFNSLSYPFFVSQSLSANGFRDVLFWNEPVYDEIPGNMQIILKGQAGRCGKIYVQRRAEYDKLIALGADSALVKKLGYIYNFVRDNGHRPEILICTNSDNVAHLSELAHLVSDMQFHVAAITEMSSKLMSVGQLKNVTLYPNVKMSLLDKLFARCDIYLDINYEGEIVDAIHRAFLNNMLILAFEETIHNSDYIADTNTFAEADYKYMAEALCTAIKYPQIIDEALGMQRKEALAADVEDYSLFI